MTTGLFITVDTEMSPALHQKGWSAQDNLASSIFGRCAGHEVGVSYQMDVMDRHGLKGVFFVDPMPAMVFGQALLDDIVGPIVERGHEVQLHIHTEWLDFSKHSPVGDLSGHSIKDFPLEAQITLLSLARELLCKAGAPEPIAFRAGNYGANDDTLRALNAIGIDYDSSFNPSQLDQHCDIDLPAGQTGPTIKHGVRILPVGVIQDTSENLRHAQICALSNWELKDALDHAADTRQSHFVMVTHSFEMLSRDRQRPNNGVKARFEKLCSYAEEHPDIEGQVFSSLEERAPSYDSSPNAPLPPLTIRRLHRFAAQGINRLVVER